MRPTEIAISNYRSIRRLSIPIHPLSVFVGENGVGKSNLYKSLSLLRDAATGQITRTIADEGGLNSVCWSDTRQTKDQADGAHQFAHQRPRRQRRLERSQGRGAAVRDCASGFFRRQAMPGNRPDQKCNAGLAILS